MTEPRKIDVSPDRPRTRCRTAAGLCAAMLLVALACPAVRADTAQIREKTADLATLKSKIQGVADALAADQRRQGELQTALEAAERKLAAARARVAGVQAQIRAQDAKLADARAEVAKAQAAADAQRDALSKQLRAAYELGGVSRLRLLLAADDPGRVGRMLGYYGYIAQSRADRLGQIQVQLRQVAALEAQVQSRRDDLTQLERTRRDAVADQVDDERARAQALAELKSRIDSRHGELKRLQASEQQLQTLIERLRSALSSTPYDAGNSTAFAKLKGRLPWPLRGALLARFGAAKVDGKLQWKGVWIEAKEGTPVRASARGRVVYVGWISSYGLIVLLQHEGGYFTLYGHDATAEVTAGTTVSAGQVIATAGDTGGYTRSGVYFEVRHGKDALDPAAWLAH